MPVVVLYEDVRITFLDDSKVIRRNTIPSYRQLVVCSSTPSSRSHIEPGTQTLPVPINNVSAQQVNRN